MADETKPTAQTAAPATPAAAAPSPATTPVVPVKEATAPAAAPEQAKPKPINLKTPPAGVNNQGVVGSDTSKVDTLGSPKEGEVGPRGINLPGDVLGVAAKVKPVVDASTVTIDSAGNPKTDELPHIGPRGASAAHVQESYVVDKHRR